MFPQRLGRPLPCTSSAWIPNHPPGFSSSFGPSSVRLAGRPPGTLSAADVKWKNGRGPLLIYTGMQYYWWKHFAAVCFLTSVFLAFVMGPYGIPKSQVCPLWMDSGSGYQGVKTFLTGAATPVYFHLAAAQMKHVTSRIMMNGCHDLSFLFRVYGRKKIK